MLGRIPLLRSALLLSRSTAIHQSAICCRSQLPSGVQPLFARYASTHSRGKQGGLKHAASRRAQLRTAVQSFAAAREATVREHSAAVPTSGSSRARLPLLPAGADARYESLRLPEIDAKGLRLRQHVNPFRPDLQEVPAPVDWATVFADPQKPLIVDIGCASGRYVLLLARECGLECNFLGLDIREPLTERASQWVETLGVEHYVHFRLSNATVGFEHLLLTYPGPLELAAVQCPDPQFKARHHKRRIVQPNLVKAIARRLAPGGHVYLSSDVHEVAVDMRRQFEEHAASLLDVSPLHDRLPTWDRAEECSCPPPPAAAAPQRPGSRTQGSRQRSSCAQPAEPESAWAAKQWLQVNPLGLETEREQWVLSQGLPMFRLLLERKAASSEYV